MAEPDSILTSSVVNPYLLSAERQGWRGLGVGGNHKRKWYTVFHNEQVLVTALLLIPGELSIRHSHESGELSIRYRGDMNPIVTWHPPGELHAGPPPAQPSATSPLMTMVGEVAARSETSSVLTELLQGMLEEQLRLSERLEEAMQAKPSPSVIIDVLFPPFKTTIDDPAAPEGKTVTGQWYD